MVFFFNDTATTEIYTLSLHDALPILWMRRKPRESAAISLRELGAAPQPAPQRPWLGTDIRAKVSEADRKSTRLNSSHQIISYAVFCLKKKKKQHTTKK